MIKKSFIHFPSLEEKVPEERIRFVSLADYHRHSGVTFEPELVRLIFYSARAGRFINAIGFNTKPGQN